MTTIAWHHPGLAEMHTKRIAVEMTRAEGFTATTVSTARGGEIPKIARRKGAEAADNKFLACQFILGANNKRYKRLKTELGNRFIFGNDDYPKDITHALALLKNYKCEGGGGKPNNNNNSKDESPVVAFVQPGGSAGDRDHTRDKSKDQCFICGKMGHHGFDCRSVFVEIRDKHMASRKKNLDAKRASKVGTQHAAVEEEELSV